jgi:hypothetical protein
MEDYERNAMSFFNTTIQTMTNLKAEMQGEMTSIPLIFSGVIDQIGQNPMKIFDNSHKTNQVEIINH